MELNTKFQILKKLYFHKNINHRKKFKSLKVKNHTKLPSRSKFIKFHKKVDTVKEWVSQWVATSYEVHILKLNPKSGGIY